MLQRRGRQRATAHLLVHFLCTWKSRRSLATVNDDNLGPAVHFCSVQPTGNALCVRVLAGIWVALSGDRYPVTFTTRYNDMMNTLFTNAVRVSVRDGVQGNWSDSLRSGLRSNINCFASQDVSNASLSQTSFGTLPTATSQRPEHSSKALPIRWIWLETGQCNV